jgi:hypothetical protein
MRRRRLSLQLLLLLLRIGQCDGLLSLDHNVFSKLLFPLRWIVGKVQTTVAGAGGDVGAGETAPVTKKIIIALSQ